MSLFGPVLSFDLVRTARRRQLFVLRCLYALLLCVTLFSVYCSWFLKADGSLWGPLGGARLPIRQAAAFATSVFQAFVLVQFLAIVVLTPAYAGPAIAEEKERRTMEFLLATDLRSREVLLSMLVSRLGSLLLILLTGLPILALLQFLGGVDPNLVLASFTACAATLVSLGSWSILCSVHAPRSREAVVLAYLGIGIYLLLSSLGWWLIDPTKPASSPTMQQVENLVFAFSCGNPMVIWLTIQAQATTAATPMLVSLLPVGWVIIYSLVHLLFGLICCTAALAGLRSAALKQTTATAPKAPRSRARPAVGNWPMLWKELYFEGKVQTWPLGRVLGVLVGFISFGPVLANLGWRLLRFSLDFETWSVDPGRTGVGMLVNSFRGFETNFWVRAAGTAVACLMLLLVAVRSASCIGGERERETLEPLLLAPLSSVNILFAKWVGAIVSVRWLAMWLGSIWVVGIFTEGLAPGAVPALVAAWLIYAAFVTGIGMWFSLVCPSSQRALLWTLVVLIGAFAGHFLFWMCFLPIVSLLFGSLVAADLSSDLQTYGLTPPTALWILAYPTEQFAYGDPAYWRWDLIAPSILLGLVVYGLVGLLSWVSASIRFSRLAGGESDRRPEQPGTEAS